MECSHWNENGLLFTSGELDEVDNKNFSSHLQECSICKRELEEYQQEKAAYFSPEFFEENPPIHVDNEIIRVCSKSRNYTVPHFNFQTLFKNTFFAMLVLVIGFGGGTYFSDFKNSSDSKPVLNETEENETSTIVNTNENSVFKDVASNKIDSDTQTNDSLDNDSLPKTFRRGNINMDGVHSVTEKR